MRLNKTILLGVICCITITNTVFSQAINNDSVSLKSAYARSLEVYHKALYPSTTLYSGVRYSPYAFRFQEGHPFFVSAETFTGSIEKDGVQYLNVRFIFETVRQVIIVFNPDGDAILMDNDRISGFNLHGYKFTHVPDDNGFVKGGFYAVLYDGSVKVMYKPLKVIRSVIAQSKEEFFIDEKHLYYIKKGNKYYPVSRKRDVLKVLRDRKEELQQLIRKEHLEFRKKNISATLIRVAGYYDKLINQQN